VVASTYTHSMTRTVNQREVLRRRREFMERNDMKRKKEEMKNRQDTMEKQNAREVPSTLAPPTSATPSEMYDEGDAGDSGLHAAFGGVAPQRCVNCHISYLIRRHGFQVYQTPSLSALFAERLEVALRTFSRTSCRYQGRQTAEG
jgi:hypothetical protein